jgi:DNA-binding winged helix-turn-helix (wHTH) protein/Tfp pilus assembly protein PilF
LDAFRFGRCTFDPDGRRLTCDGAEIALTAKGAELLAALLDHANDVVPSETLRERLWPEGFVEVGNLAQQVYLLRRALASDDSVAIENVARCGYRLRAELHPVPRARAAAAVAAPRITAARALAMIVALFALALLPTGSSERRSQGSVDAPALRSYQLGRYFWERRGEANLKTAERYFEQAVAQAPGSALGYAGIADIAGIRADDVAMKSPLHKRLAHTALSNARLAVARDPDSSVAHAALGLALLEIDAPGPAAYGELRRAIAIDPQNAEAHEWLAIRLLMQGDLAEAAQHFDAAALVQPENVAVTSWRALSRYYMRRADEAVIDFRTALEINPSYEMAQFGLVTALMERGRYREARDILATVHPSDFSVSRARRALVTIADLGMGLRTAASAEARKLAAEDRARRLGYNDQYVVAAFALSGQLDEARRVRDGMHLETMPEERRLIEMDPLIAPAFRRLTSKA